MISVVIPTIGGREKHLERCLASYENTPAVTQIIIVRNEPTCGLAWAKGGKRATGEYLHFSADDLEAHEGWWDPAISCVENGKLPCPLILRPDETIESCGQWGTLMPEGSETNIARIPFLSREMWEKGGWVLPIHYYTDNHVWHRGQELGYPTVVCQDYRFTHHYAMEGRKSTMDADFSAYTAAGGTF